MAKAIVPVVVKMFAEADGSLEGAIKSVAGTIQQAAKSSLQSVSLSTETIVKTVSDKATRALSDAKVSFISERDLAGARTGLSAIQSNADQLQNSLLKLQDRFFQISKASSDIRTIKPFDAAVDKAEQLDKVYRQLTVALQFQKRSAEELAKAPQPDLVRARQQLDDAKLLVKELQSQAAQIQKSFQSAYNESAKSLKALQAELNKKPDTSGPVQGPQLNPQREVAASLELSLLQQANNVKRQAIQLNQLNNRITEDRLTLERRISDVTKDADRQKLQAGQSNLRNLANEASLARQNALNAQRVFEQNTQDQLKAAQANSPDSKRLKLISEQSRITAANLERDAKKAESAYTSAFNTIQKAADKALGTVTRSSQQASAGRVSAGLGIFSPLANQLSSTIDSLIGSITGSSAIFRTTAGVQIGQAISQGIGQGITNGADFAKSGIDDLITSFSKLDNPSKQLIANIGTGITVAAAAAGAALGGLAGVMTKTAAGFEVQVAKLTTTFKDPTLAVERFQEALELAAKTPYNVEQVVQAQVQLSALGQKNIDILRDTVDLASGLNADLARTANEVGKAAAGSLRGYQELRNTLGITQERLKQFGAVVDSQNRLMVTNEFQIRKNREALLALIRTDFGGSSERLSRTLEGQISNLQDEIIKLSGAIGSAYIPSAKGAVQATREFFEYLNSLPQSFKTFAAGLIGTGAAVGIMTAGLAATSLALSVLGSTAAAFSAGPLAAFITRIPLASAAVGFFDIVLNTVAVKSIPLLGTSLATAAGPLALLVTAAGLLNTAFVNQQQEAEKTSELIKGYSREVANARRVNIEFKEDLVRVFQFPKDFIKDTDDAATVLQKLDKEFKSRGALSVVQDLELAGISLDKVTEKYVEQSKQLDIQQKKKEGLAKLEALLQEQVVKTNISLGAADKSSPVGASNLARVIQQFEEANPSLAVFTRSLLEVKGTSQDTFDQLDKFGAVIQGNINKIGPAVAEYKLLTDNIAAVRNALDQVQKPLEKLKEPTKYALKTGDITLVNKSLKEQEELLESITKQIEPLRAAGAKGQFSIEEASKVLSGTGDANKILLEGFIKTNETITELSNKRYAAQAEQDKIRLQAIEAQEKSELSVLTKSDKEKQLKIIRSAEAIVKARADMYLRDIKTYTEVQDALNTEQDAGERFRLQNLLDRNKERIKAEKEAFDFYIDQKKKENTIEAELDQEKYKKLKQQLETFLADTKQVINGVAPSEPQTRTFLGIDGKEITVVNNSVNKLFDDIEARPLSAAEKLKVLNARLTELRNLQKTTNFASLGSAGDDAKKSFRDNEREIENAIAKAKLEAARANIKNEKTGQKESFKDFTLGVDKDLSEAIDKSDKLKVLQDALAKLKSDEVKSHIKVNDYRAEEAKLTRQINDIQADLTKQIKDQVKDLEKIRQTRLKDEIEILEIRKNDASGAEKEAIESQLKGRRKQQIQAEFQELKAERDAELAEATKNGKNKELILDKYAAKEQELIRKAYLEHKKAEDDKLKATLDRFKAEDDALNGFKQNRLGGANSPIISLEELSFRSTLSGFGSSADSRADRLKDNFATPGGRGKVPSFESFRLKFEQENNLKLGKDGQPLPSPYDDLKPIPQPAGTQVTATVIIDGANVAEQEVAKDAAKLVKKSLVAANKKVKLLSGNDAQDLDSPPSGGLDLSFSF